MRIECARAAAVIAFAALATGCATIEAPTDPAGLPGGRPGYVIGCLQPAEIPDSQAIPPRPTQSSRSNGRPISSHAQRPLRTLIEPA